MNEKPLYLRERLLSVDALRGLAMFLILSIDIGGAPIWLSFVHLFGESFASKASLQFRYDFTEGLRLCFIAMPMFIFIVGVVIPFSMSKRLVQKDRGKIYLHIIRRSFILFILGLIAGGHLLDLDIEKFRIYSNVLEFIAIAYLVCSILVMNTNILVQFIVTMLLLLLYWALFVFIPVPGSHGNIFSGEMNLAIYVNNIVLGRRSFVVLGTVNFISNMLLGVLIGHLLKSTMDQTRKVKLLFAWGLAMFVAGLIWGQFFPIIRNLWTSSYVLVTCGISTLVLAFFYLIIDIKGYSKWAFFFIIFGVNSIAIYMMAHLFDFRFIGNVFVGGLSRFFGPDVQNFIQACAAMTVMWLILYRMYCKKTFIKI